MDQHNSAMEEGYYRKDHRARIYHKVNWEIVLTPPGYQLQPQAREGYLAVGKMLVDAGADISSVNNEAPKVQCLGGDACKQHADAGQQQNNNGSMQVVAESWKHDQ